MIFSGKEGAVSNQGNGYHTVSISHWLAAWCNFSTQLHSIPSSSQPGSILELPKELKKNNKKLVPSPEILIWSRSGCSQGMKSF